MSSLFSNNLKSNLFQRFTNIGYRTVFLIFLLLLGAICSFDCEKKPDDLVAPNDNLFPASPKNLKIRIDDSKIILSWEMTQTNGIHCYNVYKKDSIDEETTLIDSSFTMKYIDADVKNGNIYYYQVSAMNDEAYEGKKSEEVVAQPNIFSLKINNGEEYTNDRNVDLKLTAPENTKYMKIAGDTLFQNVSWENFSISKSWLLEKDDGEKNIYVIFKDAVDNETNSPAHDKIILDTQAIITEISENTSGQLKTPGQIIHFKLTANEVDGKAMIDIGQAKTGIALFDDGSNGDALQNDGIYELDFKIPSGLETVNAVIKGNFTDRAENVAESLTAFGKVTIQQFPDAVTLYPPAVNGATEKKLELYWSENQDQDFSAYRLFRAKSAGVDTSSQLITTITDQKNCSFSDTELERNITYYYRLFVYDSYGLVTGSNEVTGKLEQNDPPTPVTLYTPVPIANSSTDLSLSWSRNDNNDFGSYRIYRSKSPGVDSNSNLVTTIADQNTIQYTDENLNINTSYYYKIYVYDVHGLSSGSNEVMGKTDSNESPESVVLYAPSPIGNSLTSLNLGWSKNVDADFANYKIYRSKNPGVSVSSSLVKTITDQNNCNYDDTNLQENTTYYYKVYVYDVGGLFSESNEEMGITPANDPPLAVTLFPAAAVLNSFSSIELSWSKSEDEDFSCYKLFRSNSAGVDSASLLVTTISDINSTQFIDEDLDENTEYFYRVFVFDSYGKATGSNEEKGKTNVNDPPEAVVLAQPAVQDSITLKLTWSQNNDSDFAMYEIYRSESSPVNTSTAPIAIINNQQTTEFFDTNLEMNHQYFYRIFVKDESGLSTGSNEVSATPKP